MRLNKKSQGHIEMIISFVLFVGFLIFVFYFINPVIKVVEKTTIDKERKVIYNNLSYNIGKLKIIVVKDGSSLGKSCSELQVTIEDNGKSFKVDDKVKFAITEDKSSFTSSKNSIYTVYYGYIFDPPDLVSEINCNNGVDSYHTGSYNEEKIILDVRVKGLKNLYNTDSDTIDENGKTKYENLIATMGIGDFAFNFRNFDGIPNTDLSPDEKYVNIPENINIYSIDIPVRVIDKKAAIKEMILSIRKW